MDGAAQVGRYELRARVGGGSHGSVHRAWDPQRRREVVVKQIQQADGAAAGLIRYAEILESLRRADDTGVLAPLEVVMAGDGAPFVVFPVVPGESLEALCSRGEALQWSRAAEIVARSADALAAVARALGLVHRALKPSNLWLLPDGRVRVLDLGIAELGPCGVVARGGRWFEYRAPEQVDGQPGDERSDVFSLAIVLVEAATGVHPFAGDTAFQACQKLLGTPPDLTALTRGMTFGGAREASKLLTKALAVDPADRHAGLSELLAALNYARGVVGEPAPVQAPRAVPAAAAVAAAATEVEDQATIQRAPGARPQAARVEVLPAPPTPPDDRGDVTQTLLSTAPAAVRAPAAAVQPGEFSKADRTEVFDEQRTVVHVGPERTLVLPADGPTRPAAARPAIDATLILADAPGPPAVVPSPGVGATPWLWFALTGVGVVLVVVLLWAYAG